MEVVLELILVLIRQVLELTLAVFVPKDILHLLALVDLLLGGFHHLVVHLRHLVVAESA
jgi:hypothetical protein